MKQVLVIMGSDSDLPLLQPGLQILKDFDIEVEVRFSSAHRTPAKTVEIVNSFEKQGGKVILAAAGMSAHLAGVIAAHTILPVLGIPLSSPDFAGLDSLLSMIEMPPGIPVGVMGKGKAGAKNAALLTASILALSNKDIAKKLMEFRLKQSQTVMDKDKKLQQEGWENYGK